MSVYTPFEFSRTFWERIERARRVDLNRTKMHHPAIPVVRFSLGEIVTIVLAHERSHLCQAERCSPQDSVPLVCVK